VPGVHGRLPLGYDGAGIPPRPAGNFLLLAQKKVTKEKSPSHGWRVVVARALVKGIDTEAWAM